MEPGETSEVVQTVVRYSTDTGEKYLLGLRSRDEYWEFMGGKVKENESVKQAGLRELKEETGIELEEEDINNYREGESYISADDQKFELNPVLIDIDAEKAGNLKVETLSDEHLDYKWIELDNYHLYRTLGQFRALESLDLVEGDVALAVARKNDQYLVLKRSEETSSSGKWNFPGGKIEEDEAKKEAVLRELNEETGLQGEITESGESYVSSGELGYWRIFPFLVQVSGEPEPNYEHSDFSWIKPSELENLETLGTSTALENLSEVKW